MFSELRFYCTRPRWLFAWFQAKQEKARLERYGLKGPLKRCCFESMMQKYKIPTRAPPPPILPPPVYLSLHTSNVQGVLNTLCFSLPCVGRLWAFTLNECPSSFERLCDTVPVESSTGGGKNRWRSTQIVPSPDNPLLFFQSWPAGWRGGRGAVSDPCVLTLT